MPLSSGLGEGCWGLRRESLASEERGFTMASSCTLVPGYGAPPQHVYVLIVLDVSINHGSNRFSGRGSEMHVLCKLWDTSQDRYTRAYVR